MDALITLLGFTITCTAYEILLPKFIPLSVANVPSSKHSAWPYAALDSVVFLYYCYYRPYHTWYLSKLCVLFVCFTCCFSIALQVYKKRWKGIIVVGVVFAYFVLSYIVLIIRYGPAVSPWVATFFNVTKTDPQYTPLHASIIRWQGRVCQQFVFLHWFIHFQPKLSQYVTHGSYGGYEYCFGTVVYLQSWFVRVMLELSWFGWNRDQEFVPYAHDVPVSVMAFLSLWKWM
eukprot:PhF_6_TR27878/c1_g2_i1/m.40801